jgi:hypothetical protein
MSDEEDSSDGEEADDESRFKVVDDASLVFAFHFLPILLCSPSKT